MNPLEETIRREIAIAGVIPFARFMELALYCPQLGYYERKPDTIGRQGDFYTSVSTGSLFGEMLAFQFAEWLEQPSPANTKPQLVEAGAHDGKLAHDILCWFRKSRPSLFDRLEYVILEPSANPQALQQQTLRDFPNVRWLAKFPDSTIQRFNGIIFSNELLDAFPVHRLSWDAKTRQWFEWGVTLTDGRFTWQRMPKPIHDSRFTIHAPPELQSVLPDNYIVEVSPATASWYRDAVATLKSGKIVTIDYGLTAEELFSPERRNGTLRAYHYHRVNDDLLANIGEQDLTAHINFIALQSIGEAAGLRTETFTTQSRFLTKIAEVIWKNPDKSGDWTPAHTRQFQTLTHPEHLGRAFRVLVQSL